MTKPFNEAPPLFRSLGADNAKSQARSRTAASEAQERWPLFKAVAPVKPAEYVIVRIGLWTAHADE